MSLNIITHTLQGQPGSGAFVSVAQVLVARRGQHEYSTKGCRDCVLTVALQRRLQLTDKHEQRAQRWLRWVGYAARQPHGELTRDSVFYTASHVVQAK